MQPLNFLAFNLFFKLNNHWREKYMTLIEIWSYIRFLKELIECQSEMLDFFFINKVFEDSQDYIIKIHDKVWHQIQTLVQNIKFTLGASKYIRTSLYCRNKFQFIPFSCLKTKICFIEKPAWRCWGCRL